MMFCVECGAEGPTYQGLCARDFLKKHPVVAPPEVLDLERCTSCGSFRLKSGWSKIDRELALTGLLREAIPKLAPWERVTFTHVAREEDANNLSLTVKALGRFEDLQSVQDFRVRVRIKPSLCDSCQKQRGRYFEGTLQVRGAGGLRLADRGGPRRPRLLREHERTRQGARPRALGVVRRERVLVPEAVRPEGGPRSVPCDVPRPPRPVPHRRRGAIQGIPRGGDVGPAVRHPEGPGERRVAALQAERRPEREARRRGAVRGKDRTPGVRPDGRGPSGVRGGAARPPSAESTDRARGRRVDPGRGVLVAPPAGEFEALKGAATLSTQ